MKTEMNLETRRLSSIFPAEYNPRVELKPGDPEYEKIKSSIETFGYVDPIIINSDGTIIGGHQRYNVLLDLGYEEAQVVVVDLDKDAEKALNVALNKITGEWDEVKLKDLLSDLDLNEYDLSLTGFTTEEIEDLNVRLEIDAEAQEDEDFDIDAETEAIENPITQTGDIWILGKHRLMCGDSTDAEAVAKLMNGETADLVITDPPYNVAYGDKANYLIETGHSSTDRDTSYIDNDEMSEEDFYNFLLAAYGSAAESMREGAAIYVFHADGQSLNFRKAFRDAGLKLAQCLIWEKNTFVLGRQDYQWRHEPILYGWKEGAAHYFVNNRSLDTIICEDKPQRSSLHPTMKPIPLVGRLMKNSSKPGWNVLDLFGGSGTTLMAAEQLDRRAFLMEMDPKFCDVIVKRWSDYTGQQAVLWTAEGGAEL